MPLPENRLLSWGFDGSLGVLEIASSNGRPGVASLVTLQGHRDLVKGAMYLPDERVVSWSFDGTLRVWDLGAGTSQVLEGHRFPVNCAIHLHGAYVVSGGQDDAVRLWNLEPPRLLHTWYGNSSIRALARLDDDCVLAADGLGTVHRLRIITDR